MMKTLSNIFKQDKEKFVIPRSVQQVIPIETIWSDGIFKIGRNKFARTYKFTDINYAVASKVDKETMFLEYMDLLNSFDCGGTTKITINNRRLNKVNFEKAILIPMQEDGLDLEAAEKKIKKIDKRRADYFKYFTGRQWHDAALYDLCLNTGHMPEEKCLEVVKAYMKARFEME